jgi:regulator of nucleoside diphosphate kinase
LDAYSHFLFRFSDAEGRLTFPNEVGTSDAISVLSPLGTALLGRRPGQTIDWNDETGQNRRLTVVAIPPPLVKA